MTKISNQLDELAREARRIGVDIGPIISFSLDYMSTSEISELLYSLRDEFNTLAKKADSINNQIHEEKDKNKIRGKSKKVKINQKEYELLKGLGNQWKWIARDEDSNRASFPNELWLYESTPEKETRSWLDGKGATKRFSYDNDFQFIKWEDEEPWSIQELIEEYEDKSKVQGTDILFKSLDEPQSPPIPSSESEEKEVKKDIEWLKEELNYFIKSEVLDEREIGFELAIGEVIDLLNQLDESEVLSEYWIEQKSIDTHVDTLNGGVQVTFRLDDLQNLHVPNQKLPVIPKFVAYWIEEMKEDERPLYSVMSNLMNKTNHEWAVWKSANKNFSEIVAQAWIDGFTVEQEQKYVVKLPMSKNNDNQYAIVDYSGNIWIDALPSKYKLTEEEIRGLTKGDNLFEHFAVPVEEMEE